MSPDTRLSTAPVLDLAPRLSRAPSTCTHTVALMKLLERLTCSRHTAAYVRPVDLLPRLALPSIHAPTQSLGVFKSPTARLDPIPLGARDGGTIYWRPEVHGAGLLLLGQTGNGTTFLTKAVMEQCRTRGWQLIIADGRGSDLDGFRDTANVSFLGCNGADRNKIAAGECLAAVVIAHRILTSRLAQTATQTVDNHVGFAPMLLVLNELAGLMTSWAHDLSPVQLRQVLTMIENLLRVGREMRCHVLVVPASGWIWQVPQSWNALCTTVFLGSPSKRDAMRSASPTAVLQAGVHVPHGCKGRGMLVAPTAIGVDIDMFQSFLTYSPGEHIGPPQLPSGIADDWKRFKEGVSDATPALHPRLHLDMGNIALSPTRAQAIEQLMSLPLHTEAADRRTGNGYVSNSTPWWA